MVAPTLRRPRPASRGTSRELASPWRHVDLVLLGAVLAITALGLVMIYSATRNQQAATSLGGAYYLKRQAIYVGVGLVAMALVALIDYRSLPDVAPALYVI